MRHNTPVITLAAALALALALLLGVLLPSDNVVFAADPVFDTTPDPGSRSVPENTPPGVNIGAPISATDADEDGADNNDIEFGDTLTYSLSGTDAASFDIDPSTGQLITKAPLDYEDANNRNYSVTVTVKDSSGNSEMQNVTIIVNPVAEEPGALAAPTVVSTDDETDSATYELKVIWYAPDDGGDGVTAYDVEYKRTTKNSFTDLNHNNSATTATITGLEADTSYQVRVRAKDGNNPSDLGPWSLSSVGSTNKEDNSLPTFGDDSVMRNVLENAEPGLVVGFRVSATDDDNVLPLAYELHGPDANSFDLQASTGQIRTKRGVVYDFETKSTLNVTVTVSDWQGGTDATAVTISVTDVPEAPSRPARPTVRATQGSSRSLDVSWTEPDNTGPAITGYDLRYRKGNSGSFKLISSAGTGTNDTIAPTDTNLDDGDDRLTPGASYEVYVRAKSLEATNGGEWSAAGTGRTSAGNSEPTFDDRDSVDRENDGSLPAASTDRTVAENTRSGQSIGRAVRAVDGNGDGRTYRLVAETLGDTASEAAVAKFAINASSGQILTMDPLNHEAECSADDASLTGGHPENCTYTVKVQVWDGLDEDRNEQDTASLNDEDDNNDTAIIDDTITVNITVSDVTEKPAAPTLTVTSLANGTDLTVTWDEPDNTGPAITGYRLECTGTDVPDDQCPTDLAITLVNNGVGEHTITELTADKSYRVRLRADNDEGDGEWSTWVTQSTNKDGNALPSFNNPPGILYVAENAPSARQPVTTDEAGNNVVALQTDAGDGDSLTFRPLEGPGAGRFDIERNGQIKTSSKLNHEDPECDYDSADEPEGTLCSYVVRVKLSDPNGGSVFHSLTINVTDENEPPAAPAAPRVTATSGSGWSLEVTWNAPRNDGPPISSYQIRYRKTGDDSDWVPWTHSGTGRSAKITTIPDPDDSNAQVHLEPRQQYEVQVRALNGEGDSTENWSTSGKGTTGASNERPVFDSELPVVVELEVEENTRSGQNIGDAIEATDPDSNRLTYTLEGPGKDSFTITSAGQIRTRSSLNHEERDEYALTVKVNDGQRKNNSVAARSVTIEVTDRPEQPSTPAPPRVAGIPGSTDSIRVTWDEPANPGPSITHYSVQYAVSGSRDAFLRVPVPAGSADRSAIITDLTSGTRYDVQVRAETPEGHSDWSRSGTGSPNPDVANRNPAFSGGSRTFNVAENTPPGADVGSLVAALDPDGDTLTYILEGTDRDSFDIIATNSAGQIQTKDSLNFEEKSSYSVAVRVRDGRGGTDAVNVSIRVTDVDGEAPDTPFAPVVTALSSTSLQVNWDAPDNTGPPITDYDYRYRDVSAQTWTEVTNTTITRTTETVDGLTPSTSYDVEVRAKNAEGTSEWSNPGNRATNAPGANNLPVFTEGTSATRSVSASAPAGTLIGAPVTATDADSGDTLTYSLEGRDAPSFDINDTTGQILTRSGITLIVDEIYTLTVAADDGTERAEISVTITATAAPPNNAPVFAEGASAARTVSASAPAGTSIGAPLTATDADAGTTLTYSLEGADAASFRINSANGQLLTEAGVTLDRSTYTVDVVASDGSATSRITVTITVTPNRAPVFSEGATATRSVREDAASGTNIGNPVTATDADPGTTLIYRLEGTDAASFGINTANGQIRTSAALDAGTKSTYTVDVVASDGSLEARITVTITVTALPASFGCATRGAVSDASNTDLVSDCEALLQARNKLEGSARLNWSESTPIEQWEGVSISGTPMRVTGLNLMDRGLSGTIPDALGRLSMLTHLNLRSNPGLSGEIPDALGNLSNLRLLNLHSNSHTGAVPDLSDISGLEELYLANNADYVTNDDGKKVKIEGTGLTGRIPTWLNGMTNMEELWLWGNSLTGSVPNLSGMTSLVKLKLANNNLTGGIPQASRLPPNMTWLIIDRNPFGGSIPNLSSLSRLRLLWLHSNELTGSVPAGNNYPASLDDLNLRDNMLTGTIPDLSNLDNLTRLRLHNNSLSGEVPATLGGLASLKQLWLHNEDATKTDNGNNSFTSIAAGVGDLADTLIEIALDGNPWNANACVPESLATVAKNDYTEAGIDVCDGS